MRNVVSRALPPATIVAAAATRLPAFLVLNVRYGDRSCWRERSISVITGSIGRRRRGGTVDVLVELPEELDDPEEPEEPVNWFVVVPDEEDVIAFDPPQPVREKIARMSAPIAQNPFRFNSILDLSVGGGPTVRSS